MLAAVLGHEIAHVTLKHANERVSQQGLANIAISVVTNGGKTRVWPKPWDWAGSWRAVALWPPSKLESDRLGVRYAHGAGMTPARP